MFNSTTNHDGEPNAGTPPALDNYVTYLGELDPAEIEPSIKRARLMAVNRIPDEKLLAPPELHSPERVAEIEREEDAAVESTLTRLGYSEYPTRLLDNDDNAKHALRAVQEALGATEAETRVFLKRHVAGLLDGSILGQAFDIIGLIDAGIPEPTYLPSASIKDAFFYEGVLFTVAGHKKSGKSWLMVVLAVACLLAGRPVVYLDNENGRSMFGRRLLSVMTPDQLKQYGHRLKYVPFPQGLSPGRMRADLEEIGRKLPGALVIIDSQRSLVAQFGLNPDRSEDVETLLGPMMAAVKADEHGLTVGIIDHSNKKADWNEIHAASGSHAKGAAVDVTYYFEKESEFKRDTEGVVNVKVVDDREGLLPTHAHFKVGGQGPKGLFRFNAVSGDEVGTKGRIRREVLDFLNGAMGQRFTVEEVVAEVTGKAGDIRKALKALADDPATWVYVEQAEGERYPKFVGDHDRLQREATCPEIGI